MPDHIRLVASRPWPHREHGPWQRIRVERLYDREKFDFTIPIGDAVADHWEAMRGMVAGPPENFLEES